MRRAVFIVVFIGCISVPAVLAEPKGAAVPPKGAQYTIFCARIEGDAHVSRAQRLKTELLQKTNLNGWHVVHEERQSLLYYGFYRAFNDQNDKKETARAQNDLKMVKSITSEGSRPFAAAIFVDLESPDPAAPPEWNLLNARGAWSLQIAAYRDSPLRKEAAVDAVRDARKQGIDAYYYHGEAVSSVCIGAWPEEAVRIEADTKDQIGAMDSVLVTPAGMPDMSGVLGEQDVKVVKEKVRVVDPSLLAAMKQYPYHAVNGMQTSRKVNGKEIPDPSLLVRIPVPDEESAGLAGGLDSGTAASPQQGYEPSTGQQNPTIPKPKPAPPDPGLGKLKSVDG